MPFLGMVFMSQFPAGLNIYWFLIAFYNYASLYLLNTKNTYKLFNIPDFYPNTHLEKEYKKEKGVFLSATYDKDQVDSDTVRVYS